MILKLFFSFIYGSDKQLKIWKINCVSYWAWCGRGYVKSVVISQVKYSSQTDTVF